MKPKVVFTEEAFEFIRKQPRKAQEKMSYNIRKIEAGIKDNELFKKIERNPQSRENQGILLSG